MHPSADLDARSRSPRAGSLYDCRRDACRLPGSSAPALPMKSRAALRPIANRGADVRARGCGRAITAILARCPATGRRRRALSVRRRISGAADAMYAPVVEPGSTTYQWPVEADIRAYMIPCSRLPGLQGMARTGLRESWLVPHDESRRAGDRELPRRAVNPARTPGTARFNHGESGKQPGDATMNSQTHYPEQTVTQTVNRHTLAGDRR